MWMRHLKNDISECSLFMNKNIYKDTIFRLHLFLPVSQSKCEHYLFNACVSMLLYDLKILSLLYWHVSSLKSFLLFMYLASPKGRFYFWMFLNLDLPETIGLIYLCWSNFHWRLVPITLNAKRCFQSTHFWRLLRPYKYFSCHVILLPSCGCCLGCPDLAYAYWF